MKRLLLALVLLLSLPPGAVAADDPCAGGYPDPALSLRQSAYDVRPGEVVWLGGRLSRNGCGIGAVKVGLYLRTSPGAFRWAQTAVTSSRGEFAFSRVPRTSFDAMIVFSGTASHRRAISQIHHVGVSTSRDDDEESFEGCDNGPALVPRTAPPAGWRVELLGVPSRLRTGTGAAVKYRLTNGTDRAYRVSSAFNDGARFVLLQDVRSGARPTGIRTSDMGTVQQNLLQPGESMDVPGRLRASHCFYARIHPGSFRTVGWLRVHLREESTGDESSGNWYAPPVAVQVVP
ncbi:MAG TPA: hypothetical protein VNA12_03100 [Mycobacteriales bacterium]|nr:hypothetical protein [Mycobacteriales bacterium]